MKKISFLSKLHKEGKLKEISPSDVIKDSYAAKSESNLSSAKILLDNGKLEESVSLVYYSMYHMLTALLYKVGIKCENHSASIILLNAIFGIDNKNIFLAKKERIDKQYYTDFEIAKDDIIEDIHIAEEFNRILLDFISRLDNKKIEDYRDIFENII